MVLVVFVFFGKAWHPLPHLLDSHQVPNGSPKVPPAISCELHQQVSNSFPRMPVTICKQQPTTPAKSLKTTKIKQHHQNNNNNYVGGAGAPPTIRFSWFLIVLVVWAVCCGFWWFWLFLVGHPWGTPYHFHLISITSPTVPLGYVCHVL